MCSNPSYNYPAQPSYGEGMADAMKAQMEMLTGQTLGEGESFKELYAEALDREGGTLADILREFEAPIRKQTARMDTDILRETILGADADHKYAEDGRIITGYEKPTGGEDDTLYTIKRTVTGSKYGGWNAKEGQSWYPTVKTTLIDASTGDVVKEFDTNMTEAQAGVFPEPEIGSDASTLEFAAPRHKQNYDDALAKVYGKELKGILSPDQLSRAARAPDPRDLIFSKGSGETSEAEPIYKKNSDGTDFVAKPGTFEPGANLREGTGMVDLLGDTRRAPATMDDYGDYVRANPDLMNAYTQARAEGEERSMEEWGRDHYADHGKFEGRDLMTRQAGFDEAGNFLGLAALAEDVQRGHLSRQREADLMDVARLSGQYQDIMEDYKPGTQEALDSASKILKEREKDLTGGAITVPTGSTYGGDVDAITAAAAPTLSADTAFGGELAAAGTDPLRQRLLAEAKTGLGEGLTARELRNIQEGTRAAATARGRVRDIGSVQQEVEARLLEDRQRQAMNRAFAQQVLGQEAGLQTGDLGRGMQQEGMQADITQRRDLAQFGADVDRARMEQAQAQQAGQFDVGAKLDAERIGEQLKQSGTLGYIDAATRLAALEDRNQLDPFQAVLGRGGGGSLGAGQSLFGTAGYGLQSGPQYLNPEAGLGYISNMAANEAAMWGAGQKADASRYSGGMSLLGSLAKPIIGKLPVICWVAREVYGAHNPAWLDFREWMLLRAPSWFRALYIGYGERFAKFISDKPRLKARIRSWMDTKIGRA